MTFIDPFRLACLSVTVPYIISSQNAVLLTEPLDPL